MGALGWLLSTSSDVEGEVLAHRSVGTPPHLLEVELLDPRLVGGDGRALDADAVLLDRLGGVDGDLVVGLGVACQRCSRLRSGA